MSEQQPNAARVVTGLLLAAVAFLGLAQIAFLPDQKNEVIYRAYRLELIVDVANEW